MWQKLSRTYPPQFELVSLFLLLLTIYLTVSGYPSLPDRIPTHFNSQGFPDGWGGRSEIFIYPILGAALYILLTGINIGLAVVKDPRKLINLPRKTKARLTDAQAERLRVFLNRSLFAMKLLIQGLLAYSVYASIEIALGRATGTGMVWFIFVLSIIAVDGYMVWRCFRIALGHEQG